jgi:hypothetical protein
MNGAGELYLGYRFNKLEVSYYRMPGQDEILTELYFMKSPEDAFGLLSMDWNGEPVTLYEEDSLIQVPETVLPAQALYGSGLLRIWSGNLYARIMAFRETPEAREAVLALGKACVQDRKPAEVPKWMNSLPLSINDSWILEKDHVHFLRSQLVLNSIYFISYSNILNLDLSTEVVAGRYRLLSKIGKNSTGYIFPIRYASASKARKALDGFHKIYFPESPLLPGERSDGKPVVRLTEGNWSGYVLSGPYVVLGFEFPDNRSLEKALTEVIFHIENQIGGTL